MRRAIGPAMLLFIALQSSMLNGCDMGDARSNSTKEEELWHFLAIDEGDSTRIRKWLAPRITMLMTVDQEHASQFAPQISELVGRFNEQSPIRADLCVDVIHSDLTIEHQIGSSCRTGAFDSYLVVTNGHWTRASWDAVLQSNPAWASDRFQKLMSRINANTVTGKGTCQFVLKPRSEETYEIGGAVAVIDFSDKKLVGTCFINLFLGSIGISPFDGREQLDVRTEAASYTDFLLKQAPNGALYLSKVLYSPKVRPGMNQSEAQPILKELISTTD